MGIGFSFFADDGAIWKRDGNVEFIVKKAQEAMNKIEELLFKWGFKFSVEKTKTIFFTRKRVDSNIKLKLYNQEVDRVKQFKLLGLWLDVKIKWTVHIQKVIDKCKKVINVMRCLVGSEWGSERTALRTIYTGLMRSVLDYVRTAFGSAAHLS